MPDAVLPGRLQHGCGLRCQPGQRADQGRRSGRLVAQPRGWRDQRTAPRPARRQRPVPQSGIRTGPTNSYSRGAARCLDDAACGGAGRSAPGRRTRSAGPSPGTGPGAEETSRPGQRTPAHGHNRRRHRPACATDARTPGRADPAARPRARPATQIVGARAATIRADAGPAGRPASDARPTRYPRRNVRARDPAAITVRRNRVCAGCGSATSRRSRHVAALGGPAWRRTRAGLRRW